MDIIFWIQPVISQDVQEIILLIRSIEHASKDLILQDVIPLSIFKVENVFLLVILAFTQILKIEFVKHVQVIVIVVWAQIIV